ncbi:DUF6216 family protein [Dyella sp.]|uniref:DUF6216 family protein n=1 Tax=Dyella sp. TaxID=1869338 RepID=UPI002D789820|nr:DUF6216 family protein [Dyella sp.]HET7332617.1 DUF6216 family protein [Dyella sp.]
MDSTLVLTAFSDLAGPWKSIIIMALFAGALAWAFWRMGSPHFLIERLAALLFGKKKESDCEVDKFLQERSALMRFRLHTGVKARTLHIAHEMLNWCKANEEEMGAIRRCGKYFDIENVDFSEERAIPSRRTRRALLAVTIIFLYFVAFFSTMMFFNGVLGSIKNDKTSPEFFIRIGRISTPFRSMGSITHGDCIGDKKAVASTLGVSEEQATMVCSWLADPKMAQFLASSVAQQRVLFSIPLFLFVWLFAITYPEWATSEAAHSLQSRITNRKARQRKSSSSDSFDTKEMFVKP